MTENGDLAQMLDGIPGTETEDRFFSICGKLGRVLVLRQILAQSNLATEHRLRYQADLESALTAAFAVLHSADERADKVDRREPSGDLNGTEDQIKHMVDRFLNWRLPENFNPDGGIIFEKVTGEGTTHPHKSEPVGTNLFDAQQAKEMVRYMIEGLPVDRQWRCFHCGEVFTDKPRGGRRGVFL
ncbi:hypothetical protein [Parvibaculum sp.]|uniref:hypothetical protein n=1 Tax=Parvibaculum sp. TaxID=2024848 RepID=UPI00273731E9|nr:hypothetical protein [Parvibaculum sp.]MDP3327172.1 hypothetical protein [Parvibaculum sp.]